jgi:hypothetical protein
MRIPTREELVGQLLVDSSDLDAKFVLEHFLGKSQESIQRDLVVNGHLLTEDFMWMAPEGLRYYLPSVTEYLKRDDVDADTVAGLLCSLSFQVQHCQLPTEIVEAIRSIAEYCSEHRTALQIENDSFSMSCLRNIEDF